MQVFDDAADTVEATARTVENACAIVVGSENFRKLLELLLGMGNYLNTGPFVASVGIARPFGCGVPPWTMTAPSLHTVPDVSVSRSSLKSQAEMNLRRVSVAQYRPSPTRS